MSDQLQIRRDTAANVAAAMPAQGELAMETDTAIIRVGDGVTPGGLYQGLGALHAGWASGRYYAAGVASVQNFTMVANTLYAIPFAILRVVTFTKASFNVTTAAGTNGRIGVYKAANGLPTSLVADSGNLSTATTGVKEATGMAIALNPGLYFAACMSDNAAVLTGCQGQNMLWGMLFGLGEVAAPAVTESGAMSVAQTFGAMPANFPASPSFIASANPCAPGIFFRL